MNALSKYRRKCLQTWFGVWDTCNASVQSMEVYVTKHASAQKLILLTAQSKRSDHEAGAWEYQHLGKG